MMVRSSLEHLSPWPLRLGRNASGLPIGKPQAAVANRLPQDVMPFLSGR